MGNKLIRFYLLNFWVEISFIQVGFLGSILPLNVKFFFWCSLMYVVSLCWKVW